MALGAASAPCLSSKFAVTRSTPALRRPQPALKRRHTMLHVTKALTPEQLGVKAPQGVTQPPVEPVVAPATFGFVDNAERLNSRAAMIGFFGVLIVEAIANKGILELLGLNIGRGLGFEL